MFIPDDLESFILDGIFCDTEWCGVLSSFEIHSLVGKGIAITRPKSLSLEMHTKWDTRIK